MTIKHLVISGGGPSMIQSLGAIQHLCEEKYINIDEIESIYGTSAGAIVALIICLKYDFETIYDFIIKRPWHNIFSVSVQNIFDAYTKKGLFDFNTIEKCFKPLLEAKDLSINITLEELYNYCKVELHFFLLNLTILNLKIYHISHILK